MQDDVEMMMNTIITVALGVYGKDIGHTQRGHVWERLKGEYTGGFWDFWVVLLFQCGQEERYPAGKLKSFHVLGHIPFPSSNRHFSSLLLISYSSLYLVLAIF